MRWWRLEKGRSHPSLAGLDALLSSQTKIVALTHVSNVLGRVCDVRACAALCKQRSPGVHVVVDGVAYVPHRFADVAALQAQGVDWYAISLHKLYGPHLGAIVGPVPPLRQKEAAVEVEVGRKRKREQRQEGEETSMQRMTASRAKVPRRDEKHTRSASPQERKGPVSGRQARCGSTTSGAASSTGGKHSPRHLGPHVVLGDTLGTVSLEACAGVRGLEEYFRALGQGRGMPHAWARIQAAERGPQAALLESLRKSKRVRILGDDDTENDSIDLICGERLPTVSFVHSHYSAQEIVARALEAGVAGRCGNFLAPKLLEALGSGVGDAVVRFSLCHYNNEEEVRHLMRALEEMSEWDEKNK